VKQVEGKVQNAWGNAKDASEQAAADEERARQKNEPARESIETDISDEDEKERLRRKTG